MAYAGSEQYRQADTILNEFIRTHTDDPLKPWAERVLAYVSERKKKRYDFADAFCAGRTCDRCRFACQPYFCSYNRKRNAGGSSADRHKAR